MGILHTIITGRFLGCKTEDERGRRRPFDDPYPYLLHRRQNQNPCYADSSKSSHRTILNKILNFHRVIFKAIKGLLQKAPFIFNPRRPREQAGPILPVQNPAPQSTSDDDPISLVQPLLNPDSSADDYSTTASNALLADSSSDDNVDVVSSDQNWPEEYNRKQMDCVIISIPDLTHFGRSLACTCATQEIVESAVVTEQSMATVESADVTEQSMATVESADVTEESMATVESADFTEQSMATVGINSSEDHKEIIKSKVVVQVDAGIRWIKHYSSRHRILLVGEGDFSFSASLAVAFGWASNIIATSLDSEAFLKENYKRAPSNIKQLRSRGSKVMHGIDATKMADHALLQYFKFDRIIYNFPFAGFFKELSRKSQLRRHRRLVSLFMKHAKEMISEDGQIHISHKTNEFHNEWNLVSIASSHGLVLIEEVNLNKHDYPGYNTKYGFGGDNNFNCHPANTYKFGLKRVSY